MQFHQNLKLQVLQDWTMWALSNDLIGSHNKSHCPITQIFISFFPSCSSTAARNFIYLGEKLKKIFSSRKTKKKFILVFKFVLQEWSLFWVVQTLKFMEENLLHSKTGYQNSILTSPSMKLTLPWWGGLSTKKFHASASTRRTQLSVATTTINQVNKSSQLWCQDLS